MRTVPVRFTIRCAFVSLALIALAMGAESLRRRVAKCRERAAYHASEQSRLAAARDARLRQADADPAMRPVALFDVRRHGVAIAWHGDRQRLVGEAAWRPWRAIASSNDRPPWPAIPPELYPPSKSDTPAGSGRLGTALVDAFLFHPMRYPEGDWARSDTAIEVAWFRTGDGIFLNGWFAAAKRPRAVVLYCEGNAGNISGRRWVLELFRDRMKSSVLLFDYRGYGRSEGIPNQPGILEDARAARRWLAERTRVTERDIVLVGNSLGGAVAVDLAARDGARGLVLENTFSSLAELTEWHFGRLARMVVSDTLDSRSKIGNYAGPLLQTHGDADTTVPFALGKRLFDAAKAPKRFVAIPRGGHNDPPAREYLIALDRFLDQLRRANESGP